MGDDKKPKLKEYNTTLGDFGGQWPEVADFVWRQAADAGRELFEIYGRVLIVIQAEVDTKTRMLSFRTSWVTQQQLSQSVGLRFGAATDLVSSYDPMSESVIAMITEDGIVLPAVVRPIAARH